jgi:Ran GTPase-activating protein (RanGAP) involved in mRNA processing and transport
MGTMKTPTRLCLSGNPIRSEGATILAHALGRNAMPNLKRLYLGGCHMSDDGFVALVSALEQNTSLQILKLRRNHFAEQACMALAESLPNIKGLEQLSFTAYEGFQSNLPLLLEGFRKNTSLVKVTIDGCARGEWSQVIKVLGHRNRCTPLLKAFPSLGIWSRALAKVATEPAVIFHILRNKPKLVGSAGHDDE